MIKPLAGLSPILAAAAFATACQPRTTTAGGSTVPVDTLTGIVALTGTSFEKTLVLRPQPRSVRLIAPGPDSAALARIGGVEVEVRGTQTSSGFTVASFQVVRVAGKPVQDGILVAGPTGLMLRVEGRVLPLGNPPRELHSMIGSRIWVEGPLSTGPITYGLIAPQADPTK